MKAILRSLLFSLFLVLIDLYFRSELLTHYSPKQVSFYIFSVVLSVCYLTWILALLQKLAAHPLSFSVFAVLTLSPFLLSILGSYAFFSLNGLFPNYYTLLYFKTEPKSAMSLLKDIVNPYVFLLLIGFMSGLVWCLWRLRSGLPKLNTRALLLYSFLQIMGFETLVFLHKNYDQCAIVDANFAACLQRHALTWDDHSTFKGTGLGVHRPAKLGPVGGPNTPNVVVIVLESFRQRSAQLYGNPRHNMPELTAFANAHASDFYQFQDAVSVASTTMLAVPGILSGIAPYQDSSVLLQQPLIWEMGKQRGSATFFLSSHTLKWYRFDRFYQKAQLNFCWNKDNAGLPFYNDLGVDDKHTIAQLKTQLKKRKKQPFFGVVQLNATHYPYRVPKRYERYKGGHFKDGYDNAIYYQDALIGDFLHCLSALKLDTNTLVIIVSDHGESLMEHRSIGHVETHYSESIRIPLVAYIPKQFLSENQQKNLRKNSTQLVSNIDIAPTILEILGLQNRPEWQQYRKQFTGYSLLSKIPSGRCLISMNNNQFANFYTGISVCTKNWHYLLRGNLVPNRQELYFWKKDPNELHNRLAQHPLIKKHVIAQIRSYPNCEKWLKKITH
ncbi:MAG: hypothetical protein RLZZ301_621 [Bacteroidota bacterium]|jgi:glucan phosphoethanolaminetransferase (alkaline phosphatase superfamily)